jgi:hypothetical protein
MSVRKAKKLSRTQVSDRNFPGSMVCQTSTPSTANAAIAMINRPRPAGLRSTTYSNELQQKEWCTGEDSNLRSA